MFTYNNMSEIVPSRKRRPDLLSVRNNAAWVAHDASMRSIIAEVTTLIEFLERLSPSGSTSRDRLAKSKADGLRANANGERGLIVAEIMAREEEIDAQWYIDDAANRSRQTMLHRGHRYGDLSASGTSKLQAGDYFAEPWIRMGAVGAGHSYDSMAVDGNARSHMGNSYGGKSVFSD